MGLPTRYSAARLGDRASGRDQGGHQTAQRLAEEQQRVQDGPPGFGTLGTLGGRPGKSHWEICSILDGETWTKMVTKWTTVFFFIERFEEIPNEL